MTQNQIEYLRSLIPSEWTSARRDFDLCKSLREYNEPFIMVIADWTVSINRTGVKHFLSMFQREPMIYAFLYDKNNVGDGLTYHANQDTKGLYKYLWYDGVNGFHKINKEKALALWEQTVDPWHEYITKEHEYAVQLIKDGLEIEITCQEFFDEQMAFSKSNGGNLQDVITRIKKWMRHATNQKIVIGRDSEECSFKFCEYINNHAHMKGGIIFCKGKWNIYT